MAAEQVAINARAAVRAQIGGVERYAREMAHRLPALRPERYQVVRPPEALAHRAGHAWEQAILPALAREAALIYSPANLAPVVSRRNVLVIHDVAALRHPEGYSPGYVAYQRRLLPLLARRARLLITVSEFSKRELVEVLEVAPERITVIPEGVDERFGAVEEAAGARFGLERPYVLVLGTISARKNLGVLSAAARALRERGLELVHAGSERSYLRSPPVSIRRLGYVPEQDLPPLYAGARALAMPSRYEGFGLPCLEAMACGTPIVAADCGALPEIVSEAGVLVDPDDEDGWSAALLAVAAEERWHAELAAAGRERALKFTWTRTAELTDRAIGSVLGQE